MPRQRGLEARALAIFGDYPVSLTHCAGHPGELRHLGQGVEGSDYAATTPAGLRMPVRGHPILYRPAIARHDKGPFR